MDAWEPGTEMVGETTDEAWADQLRLVDHWHGCRGRTTASGVCRRGGPATRRPSCGDDASR